MDIGKLTILAGGGGIYVVAAVPVHPFALSIVSPCKLTTRASSTQKSMRQIALIADFVKRCAMSCILLRNASRRKCMLPSSAEPFHASFPSRHDSPSLLLPVSGKERSKP